MHDSFIQSIEFLRPLRFRLTVTGRTGTKTNPREWRWRHQLPVRRGFDPRLEYLRQPAVLANSRRQSLVPEITNDHPELQRPKTAPELDPIVRPAPHLFLFRSA